MTTEPREEFDELATTTPPPEVFSTFAPERMGKTWILPSGSFFHGTLGSFHLYAVSSTCIVGCNGFGSLFDVALLGVPFPFLVE